MMSRVGFLGSGITTIPRGSGGTTVEGPGCQSRVSVGFIIQQSVTHVCPNREAIVRVEHEVY